MAGDEADSPRDVPEVDTGMWREGGPEAQQIRAHLGREAREPSLVPLASQDRLRGLRAGRTQQPDRDDEREGSSTPPLHDHSDREPPAEEADQTVVGLKADSGPETGQQA